MDALMAALVAAILTQASDRTPWLTAILSTRFARPGAVIAGVALALAIINAIGAVGGALIAPHITPNARALLLALALASAGVSALWEIKPPKCEGSKRLGAFAASMFAVLALGLGDRTQFITAALAARTPVPALAAIGATIGALAVNIPATMAGEAGRAALPVTPIRITIGMVLLIAGLWIGFSALRLI